MSGPDTLLSDKAERPRFGWPYRRRARWCVTQAGEHVGLQEPKLEVTYEDSTLGVGKPHDILYIYRQYTLYIQI